MRRVSTIVGDTKDCTRCRERFPLENFSPDRRQSSGRQAHCKACRYEYMKRYMANDEWREEMYARRRVSRRSDPRASLIYEAKKRAKKRGTPFSIEIADITVPEVCPVFGVRLQVADGGCGRDFSPSLDCIIPGLGYVRGNIQIISNLANRMKNSATPEQLKNFANWVLSESAEANNGKHSQLKAVA